MISVLGGALNFPLRVIGKRGCVVLVSIALAPTEADPICDHFSAIPYPSTSPFFACISALGMCKIFSGCSWYGLSQEASRTQLSEGFVPPVVRLISVTGWAQVHLASRFATVDKNQTFMHTLRSKPGRCSIPN